MVGTDLTKGNVGKTLLRFTVPFILSNLLHTLYGIVDLFIVGRYTDSVQMSAVSIGSLTLLTINFLILGLGTGATVIVGQACGAKRQKDLEQTISTIFCAVPLFSIVIMLLCLAFRHPILRLIHTPPESFQACEDYVRICFYGMFFTGMFAAISAVLRGLGDSKSPTIFVALSCIINIFGDLICVKMLGMGAAGAALATSVAQGCSVVLGLAYLRRKSFPFDFRPGSFRIYKDKLRKLFMIGTPTALQETITNITFLMLEAIINDRGYIASASAGVADRIFNLSSAPAVAFSASIAAMVAQNVGAGQYERGRKCLWVGMLFSGFIGICCFTSMVLFPVQVISIFTKDPEVISNAAAYMTFYKVDMIIFSFAFCVLGYINGVAHTRYTMTVNIISSFAVRLPLVWLISRRAGATLCHIGFGLPSASLVQLILGLMFLVAAKSEREYRRRRRERLHDQLDFLK